MMLTLGAIVEMDRGAGHMDGRFGLPEVLGQLFMGFLLGPSLFAVLLYYPDTA
ncbi:MAG TPA: hypothetical protein VF898_13660 [Chloroflexota bacterium]